MSMISQIGRRLCQQRQQLQLQLKPLIIMRRQALSSQGTQQVRLVAKKEMEQFWEKNRKMQRPWSPHLQIYGLPITMLTSLVFRVSGITMGVAWPLIGVAGFWVGGNWVRICDAARSAKLSIAPVFAAKAAICFFPAYHLINGLRHLAYDLLYGFSMPATKTTGVLVLSLSVAATLLAASVRVQPKSELSAESLD